MRVFNAPACLPDSDVAALEGKSLFHDGDYDLLLRAADGSVTVLKPDGSPLLVFLPDVLPADECSTGLSVFRRMTVGTFNRGMAAGEIDPTATRVNGLRVGERSRTRFRPLREDGTVSATTYARWAPSGFAGFWEPDRRNGNYCRLTAFSLNHPGPWRRVRPFLRSVDRVFQQHLPERHAAQLAVVRGFHPDFRISDDAGDIAFSTVTVNHNWATAVHRDAEDLSEGFGVMAVLDDGAYDGCYLVFPKYRTAVDMRRGGVLLADVHELHGNTPFIGRPGDHLRVSLVFYVRDGMKVCVHTKDDEHRRSKAGMVR